MKNNSVSNISVSIKNKIRSHKWTPNNVLDLHELGVHFFDVDLLPTTLDPHTFASIYHRGLTPPNALPRYFREDVKDRIKDWLEFNYFKLRNGGVHHLGQELNLNPVEKYGDSKLKVIVVRLSDYETIDGAFGHHIITEFCNDFDDNIFFDYAYVPPYEDLHKYISVELPLLFGSITKRPLFDFDVIAISHCWPPERVLLPSILVNSGIPLHRWERFEESFPYNSPIILLGGMGASSCENLLGDNPVHGPGQNSFVDHVAIGEGELVFLKYLQELYQVYEHGGTKKDFFDTISNEKHQGIYDPTRILFEYKDKIHILKDYKGNILEKQSWEGGGQIDRISLLDYINQERYVLAGEGSEEFEDFNYMQKGFIKEVENGTSTIFKR